MFRRVILESWHDYVPYVCFALIGGAFIMILIRAFTMSKDDVDRISHIPLEDNRDNQTER
ncbi:hypothetical protein VSU19_03350 [Verrucomicrobiales bacterium BCK34]|nr:hypothetical protein [Verrucomicrobiales bacterium BCK34]